jgi:hypothetical protein
MMVERPGRLISRAGRYRRYATAMRLPTIDASSMTAYARACCRRPGDALADDAPAADAQ